jgi:pimeloyl-ACP methyl ester carboxylesterase
MTDPQQAIAAVEAQATRHQTPCAEGALTWRRWGKGDDVLLLHGGSGSWLHWLRTIPALAERFSVWAPDLPGMGDSAPPPEPPHFDTYCATVLEGFKALRPGDAPVSLVGFSFGSSIAVRLAASLPAKHLVLSGANFAVQTQRPRRNLISLRRAPDEAARAQALAHNVRVMMIAHEENVDALGLALYDIDTRRRRLQRTAINNLGIIRAELPRLALAGRMAAIAGADDQVIGDGEAAQRAHLAELRPGAPYLGIARAGHWVMHEAAAAYNAALLSHLD